MAKAGVPLAQYRSAGAGVLLACEARGCFHRRVLPLESVIARLNARGLAGEKVGIIEAARYVVGPCPEGGARAWSTRPAFPSFPGQDGTKAPPETK